ncbi:TlpA family protein disulfide reductase [Paenibacillus tundrae]|uniref:TlpA family protein disulfide reductase n=1 Tax=Paenibacillus tundrae TaxID=528187 RepID=UPI0030D5DCA2
MRKHKRHIKRMITILIGTVAVLAGVWAVFQGLSPSQTQRVGAIESGAIAPDFMAPNSVGDQVSLSDYRGKVVMINFWASWCTPCVREMPLLHQTAEMHQEDVETLFVNVGESKGTIQEFMNEQQFDFPVIVDVTGKISTMYRITGLPATMVIDREGKFSHILHGELTNDTPLAQWLEDAK